MFPEKTSTKMKAQAERSLVRLPSQNVDALLCLHTHCLKRYEGKKYLTILKCAKHYDTKECGYNSKERLAYHLFRKIIHAYLIFFIRDLVYNGLEVLVPSRQNFKFRIVRLSPEKSNMYEIDPDNADKYGDVIKKII